MERPRIYCLAKSLDLAVIKLTRKELDATTDLLDLFILRKSFFVPLRLILIRTIYLSHFSCKCAVNSLWRSSRLLTKAECRPVTRHCFEFVIKYVLLRSYTINFSDLDFCAPLRFYAASNGRFLPTFRDNLSAPSSRAEGWSHVFCNLLHSNVSTSKF
jgi:hypothetical protein